jgi:predicted ArsR family transcriptional regulator
MSPMCFPNRYVGEAQSPRAPKEPDITTAEPRTTEGSLVGLLGASRAAVVRHLKDAPGATVAELATHLAVSEVAARRHVDRLATDGLISSETDNRGRGRPVARWSLTGAADDLFPQRYDEVANELLGFLADSGRTELGEFLRWRQERQVASYTATVDADDISSRVHQLAEALSADGYRADVQTDGQGFTLRQQHCTIEKVARENPLLCGHEAAAFGRLLGDDVRVTRRETIANGDGACVCHVQVRESHPNALPVIAVSSPTTSCCDTTPTQAP